ncbi:MAG: MBL fold metallo-hydrolase [Hyphomonadaceae bacterium]|nr:MBL fold metallo-hydrolase [Clostridia bacterium]
MITFCSLYSGSSGNAIYMAYKNTRLLIDAGVSGKKIEAALAQISVDPKLLTAILVTHEHGDHISGVGVMARRYQLPIYANKQTWRAMYGGSIGKIEKQLIQVVEEQRAFELGDFGVQAVGIPHDAAGALAYSFFANNKKVSIATDIGYNREGLLQAFEGSDLMLLEANHDIEMLKNGAYPYPLKRRILSEHGHLSNAMAGEMAVSLVKSGTRKLILGHLSQENNEPQLAYDTVCEVLAAGGIRAGKDIEMEVAQRYCVSHVHQI